MRNWERGTAGNHRAHRPASALQPPEPVAQALADWRTGSGTVPVLDPPIGLADHVRTAETQLKGLATRCVADPDRLLLELDAGHYRGSVAQQIHQATASGANTVPEIYINGGHYRGPILKDDLVRTLRAL